MVSLLCLAHFHLGVWQTSLMNPEIKHGKPIFWSIGMAFLPQSSHDFSVYRPGACVRDTWKKHLGVCQMGTLTQKGFWLFSIPSGSKANCAFRNCSNSEWKILKMGAASMGVAIYSRLELKILSKQCMANICKYDWHVFFVSSLLGIATQFNQPMYDPSTRQVSDPDRPSKRWAKPLAMEPRPQEQWDSIHEQQTAFGGVCWIDWSYNLCLKNIEP